MRSLVGVLLLLVVLPVAGHAQAPGNLTDVLESARRGDDYIRITLAERSIEGRVRDIEDDSVRLAGGSAALADIRSVEERRKEGGGTMIGALAGGIGMALLLVPLAGLCESECDGAGIRLALVGAALGGTVGGLIGAVVAPGEEHWEPRWRAP